VGGKKWRAEHKSGNISETRKEKGKVTMEGLQKLTSALLNGTILDPLHTFSSPRLGFATPKTSIVIISGTGKAMDFKFGW